MSAELSLSTRTLLVLNPSIMSITTRGSSCGCFTLLASSSKKTISKVSLLLHFDEGVVWTLLTCLYCDFLRDINDPPAVRPPLIIIMIDLHLWACLLILLTDRACAILTHPFFINFCNFPFQISSSIRSFKSLQSFVQCP